MYLDGNCTKKSTRNFTRKRTYMEIVLASLLIYNLYYKVYLHGKCTRNCTCMETGLERILNYKMYLKKY